MINKGVYCVLAALMMSVTVAVSGDPSVVLEEEAGLSYVIAHMFKEIARLMFQSFPDVLSNATTGHSTNLSSHEEFKKFEVENSEKLSFDPDENEIDVGYPREIRVRRNELDTWGAKYPQRIRIRRGADYGGGDEMMSYENYDDETGGCSPKGLKTAEVKCIKWPSFIVCFAYCIYGHTYPEGIVRETNCKLDNGRWSSPFEECKPFVDCTLRMTKPGSLKCITNEVMKKPTCDITCEAYEKNEKMNQKVRCDSEGKWEPSKPFCVDKKGIDLVPPPKQREHGKLNFPKKKPT